MINEVPIGYDHLEADLEQADMFLSDMWEDPEPSERITHTYREWRHSVRARGFRYINMLSNKDTRVITVIFCRCPMAKVTFEEVANEEKTLRAVHQTGTEVDQSVTA